MKNKTTQLFNKNQSDTIKLSIKKWEDIINGFIKDKGTRNCPLCHIYYEKGTCKKCPIFLTTNETFCYCTPYDDWCEQCEKTNNYYINPHNYEQAINELEFLKKLLHKTILFRSFYIETPLIPLNKKERNL